MRDSWRRQLPGGWRRRPRRPGARLAAGKGPRATAGGLGRRRFPFSLEGGRSRGEARNGGLLTRGGGLRAGSPTAGRAESRLGVQEVEAPLKRRGFGGKKLGWRATWESPDPSS